MAAARAIPLEELFDPDFLEEAQRLRIVARRVAHGGRFAEQRSKDLGHGLEFRDFRPYAPGDDLRGVDWNIYRRLHRVFLRQFEELEDLPLYLVPDVSGSMFLAEDDGLGAPTTAAAQTTRAHAALRTTLALAAISLGQHDTVGVFPFHATLDVAVRPTSGKNRSMAIARALAAIEPGGKTDLAGAVRALQATRLRQGLVVVISDFFDPEGLGAFATELSRMRHRVLLVQLARASDRDPAVRGDLRLVDCETETVENVSITPTVLQRYRDAYDRFAVELTRCAEQRGAGLLRIDVDRPIVPQLAEVFEAGAYRA